MEALADIVEVIKVNFLEDRDIEKVWKEDSVRDVDIKKLDEKQVKGQFRNLQVFSIIFKHDPVGIKIVESWKEANNFDSSKVDLKIQVREIQRRK